MFWAKLAKRWCLVFGGFYCCLICCFFVVVSGFCCILYTIFSSYFSLYSFPLQFKRKLSSISSLLSVGQSVSKENKQDRYWREYWRKNTIQIVGWLVCWLFFFFPLMIERNLIAFPEWKYSGSLGPFSPLLSIINSCWHCVNIPKYQCLFSVCRIW